jgi:hypothetical protein
MATNNARRFVEKLKQDLKFRKKALATTESEYFLSLRQEEGIIQPKRTL